MKCKSSVTLRTLFIFSLAFFPFPFLFCLATRRLFYSLMFPPRGEGSEKVEFRSKPTKMLALMIATLTIMVRTYVLLNVVFPPGLSLLLLHFYLIFLVVKCGRGKKCKPAAEVQPGRFTKKLVAIRQ
uniref:Uncharacterized protein n=1 Tax=Anopheles aquasalis TaxID=42839 RepID=T1DP63_ANOAQ